MNILTHAVHTGYQFDLAKTGHQFYSLDIPCSPECFWDFKSRPLPSNYHRLKFDEEPPVKFDLALAHFGWGYDCLKRTDLPLIFKEHCLRRPFDVSGEWFKRISYYTFASQAAQKRWKFPEGTPDRSVMIGMGMDLTTYGGYTGQTPSVLGVAQNVTSRGNEKGYDVLMQLGSRLPMTLVGMGNKGLPGAVGEAVNYEALLAYYREHRAFLNPCNTLGMSTLEAMATGMPVVSFRTLNSDIIEDGVNGFVVDTVEEAEGALTCLLKDKWVADELGRKARETIKNRFRIETFVQRWNNLFNRVVNENRANPGNWARYAFDIETKPVEERILARSMTVQPFEYRRVGYDKRTMRFLMNGRIGGGAGGCELFWDIKKDQGELVLEISSGDTLTCRLRQAGDGVWAGHWVRFEKMPVLVTPIVLIEHAERSEPLFVAK